MEDAAATLQSCVTASLEDGGGLDSHFFEVRLSGFYNPPIECTNVESLRSFLSQVSPLPYRPEFQFSEEIQKRAAKDGLPIQHVKIFVRDGAGGFEELFKPYGNAYNVKSARVPLTHLDYLSSLTGRWWGWIGRKRVSGAFKDPDARGIRVRVRNIQIDDTKIIRDIFAVSHIGGNSRSSYARFADWYVGEIFVQPNAAIPNARRDGFEEDEAWELLRNELDEQVAEKYGKLAYKTSKADQLSVESLTKRISEFERPTQSLLLLGSGDWDKISQSVSEANEIQRRLKLAVKTAEDEELAELRSMTEKVSNLKRSLDSLISDGPRDQNCDDAIATATSELTQKIYRALKKRLSPAEWPRVRDIISDVTGEKPQ